MELPPVLAAATLSQMHHIAWRWDWCRRRRRRHRHRHRTQYTQMYSFTNKLIISLYCNSNCFRAVSHKQNILDRAMYTQRSIKQNAAVAVAIILLLLLLLFKHEHDRCSFSSILIVLFCMMYLRRCEENSFHTYC